ncbi:nucleoside-diphosphate-sugar epimerase [Kitasatospora sp. MAP12-15]|uniref:NAD-dependent epimerase/dehydratase family protein n=1 Tax=unclassified Kitasatospora TaxID=2633591 RepID=UPI0024755F59|nr:NAD-dependent epimerase/dehydratase family protein [Kitasatospora sp. MAP12-44]MDH6108528.1 nucleoside-diphosphate-sugar epimerase [Kitasatospora sp. MAP12-44]
MRTVVTGAAGFIGSHLCEHLLGCGDEVVGVDSMTDYYDPGRKERNLAALLGRPRFAFRRADLLGIPLAELFATTEVVYHLAGQPGVRASWGENFAQYLERNVQATQRVLEAARGARLRKLVYASSSSVYGDAEAYPTAETLRPRPVSPYGVTKLAAEHLCELYRTCFGLPTVSLRLFSVYGPRQRPDMAFARLIPAALTGDPFPLHGDGLQTRDFTYVRDVVTVMRQAALRPWTGVANVGGGQCVTMNQVIDIVSELAAPVVLRRLPEQDGDVRHTAADTALARRHLGYRPRVGIREGLAAMVEAERATRVGALVGAAAAGAPAVTGSAVPR